MKKKFCFCLVIMVSLLQTSCANAKRQDNAAIGADSIFVGTSIVREADRAMVEGQEEEGKTETLQGEEIPESSPMPTETETVEKDPAAEATSTPKPTATATPTPTATPKPTATATPMVTATPMATPTPTATPTATPTPMATPTPTATPTPASTPTPPPTHVHSYEETVTVQATCTTSGTRLYQCSCGDSFTAEIPPTNHRNTTWSGTVFCDKDNVVDEICQDCGMVVGKQTIPAGGHKWTTVTYIFNGVLITEVKCSVAGCGAVQSHTETPVSTEP